VAIRSLSRSAAASTPEGEALFAVMLETLQTFHRLRAAGRRLGAVTRWGGGSWGLLRSLRLEGPQTVPQLARARPVTRQRIQKLVDELAAEGLVELVDNPAHRRSRLVRLTRKGATKYDEITSRILAEANRLAAGFSARDLRVTVQVLARLRERLG
jgi:DNA-binding MarR family transcriptional regulator